MQKTNEIKEFPLEHFLPIDNEPFFLCRVSIFPVKQKFISELDIVQKESLKIHKHVETLYHQENIEEALNNGIETLARFLRGANI